MDVGRHSRGSGSPTDLKRKYTLDVILHFDVAAWYINACSKRARVSRVT